MKKKIALVSEHASPLVAIGNNIDSGGQNVYVAQVTKHLAAMGYEVDVFTRRDNWWIPEVVDWKPGVRVIHVPAGPASYVRKEELLPFMEGFAAWMMNSVRFPVTQYDLIHANFWMSGLAAMKIRRALGVPYIITFHALGAVRRLHQGSADRFPEERMEIECEVAREADAVIAECPQDREDLLRYCGADEAKIRIIPCGYDPEELWPVRKESARKLLGIPPGTRVILQLGRMVPRKGVETVVRGFARFVHERRANALLLVAGGSRTPNDASGAREIARLQNLAEKLGVGGKVRFVGSQARAALKYYYSAADMFITAPWYEPFGITPLESMACATPVIGSCVGGIKSTVVHGRTGWLVPPRDQEAVAEKIAYFDDHPAHISLFGRYAHEHVQRYRWDRVTREIADLYESLPDERFEHAAPVRRFALPQCSEN